MIPLAYFSSRHRGIKPPTGQSSYPIFRWFETPKGFGNNKFTLAFPGQPPTGGQPKKV